jgi:hypothetical protein
MILKCRLRRVAAVLAVAGIAAVVALGHDAFASEFKVGTINRRDAVVAGNARGRESCRRLSHHQERRSGARSARLGDRRHRRPRHNPNR